MNPLIELVVVGASCLDRFFIKNKVCLVRRSCILGDDYKIKYNCFIRIVESDVGLWLFLLS